MTAKAPSTATRMFRKAPQGIRVIPGKEEAAGRGWRTDHQVSPRVARAPRAARAASPASTAGPRPRSRAGSPGRTPPRRAREFHTRPAHSSRKYAMQQVFPWSSLVLMDGLASALFPLQSANPALFFDTKKIFRAAGLGFAGGEVVLLAQPGEARAGRSHVGRRAFINGAMVLLRTSSHSPRA